MVTTAEVFGLLSKNKKALSTAGASALFIFLVGAMYSDRGDAAILKIIDLVVSERREEESRIHSDMATMNSNLFKLQQTIITKERQDLEELKQQKEKNK